MSLHTVTFADAITLPLDSLSDSQLDAARAAIGLRKLSLRRTKLRTNPIATIRAIDTLIPILAPLTARIQAITDEEDARRQDWGDELERRRLERLRQTRRNRTNERD